jgi:hypothetical protein
MTERPETTEFNKMLASDMPLVDVVRHWYRAVLPNVSSLEALNALPDAESAAYNLTMVKGLDTYVIDPARADANFLSIDSVLRDSWTQLENARLALRQASC